MRLLPKGLIIHEWVVEGNKLTMSPIHVSVDGMQMHIARPETVKAYNVMAQDALHAGVKLKIIWAYRSGSLQRQQFEEAQKKYGPRGALKWLAPPGFSEHQTGWALDIGDETDPQADDNPLFERTAAFRWLKTNARRYGFELSFPPKNWQGISYEPWHWRYVGTLEAHSTFHPMKSAKVAIWGLSFWSALRRWMTPSTNLSSNQASDFISDFVDKIRKKYSK